MENKYRLFSMSTGGCYSSTYIYIDIVPNWLVLCFTNVEKGKTTIAKCPSTKEKSGSTTNTLAAKCKDYHTKAQELFDDAFREVNDTKTYSSSTKQELGKAFARALCRGITSLIGPIQEKQQEEILQ
jgi:hypothetical protein